MSDMTEKVLAVEARAKKVPIKIGDLCKLAKINRTTWQRWKSGDRRPMLPAWERIMEAIDVAERGE